MISYTILLGLWIFMNSFFSFTTDLETRFSSSFIYFFYHRLGLQYLKRTFCTRPQTSSVGFMTAVFAKIDSLTFVCIKNIRFFNYLMCCLCHTSITEAYFRIQYRCNMYTVSINQLNADAKA